MAKLGILIDAQNDFITGTLKNDFAKAKVPNIVDKVKNWNDVIIATHDTHFNKIQVTSGWPPVEGKAYEETLEGKKLPVPHCIKLTDGWEIEPTILAELQKKNEGTNHNFYAVDKYTFGMLDLPKFINHLGIEFDEIEIWGFVSSICVLANAVILRAAFPNMKITVDANCIADLDEDGQNATILCLQRQQIDVINV